MWHVRARGNVTRDSRTSVPARKRTSAAVAVPVPPVASSSRTRHSRGGWSATTRRRTRRPARDAALETRTICCCRLGSRSRVTDPTSRSSPPEVAHATTETTASPSAAPIESSSEAPVSEGDIARVPDRPRDERVPSGREGRSRPRNERARTSAAARARRCVLRHDRTSRRMRPLGETQKRFSGRPEKTLRLLLASVVKSRKRCQGLLESLEVGVHLPVEAPHDPLLLQHLVHLLHQLSDHPLVVRYQYHPALERPQALDKGVTAVYVEMIGGPAEHQKVRCSRRQRRGTPRVPSDLHSASITAATPCCPADRTPRDPPLHSCSLNVGCLRSRNRARTRPTSFRARRRTPGGTDRLSGSCSGSPPLRRLERAREQADQRALPRAVFAANPDPASLANDEVHVGEHRRRPL